MTIDPSKIVKVLKNQLPGTFSHKKMLPPNRVLTADPADKDKVRYSSVLLLLFPENNKLKVCLIKRPAHMKHHAGQIALPGGQNEANETPEETALRETTEEIGISPDLIRVLGRLSPFYVEVSRFEITPIVGWTKQKPEFKISADEVQKVIVFPVDQFKPPFDKISIETLTGILEVPCVKYEGEIIWGATAMILSEFFDVISQIND